MKVMVGLGVLVGSGSVRAGTDQKVWLVFKGGCITGIERTPETELRFPVVDGKADKKRGELREVKVDFVSECGEYVVERVGDGK